MYFFLIMEIICKKQRNQERLRPQSAKVSSNINKIMRDININDKVNNDYYETYEKFSNEPNSGHNYNKK